jgi:hypothetical protein
MRIPLRIAEPTGRCRRDLRRFTFKGSAEVPCSREWGHDATAVIGVITEAEAERVHGDNWPHDDPRWPKTCEHCGYEFRPADEWQRNDNALFRLPDGTEFTTWGGAMEAPPGAMVRATWYDEYSRHPGGIDPWLIALPDGGTWITSSEATDGAYWTVTGTAPDITVSPSIWHNAPSGWHGWIRNGELVDA